MRNALVALLLVGLTPACSDDSGSTGSESSGRDHPRSHDEAPPREHQPVPLIDTGPELQGAPPTTHPVSDHTAPPELTIGQWVRYKVTWREGAESSLTYAVVGAEEGAYWLEIDDRRRGARKVFKLLVSIGDRSDVSTLEVRQLITYDGRERSEVPPRLIQSFQPVFRQLLSILFADWSQTERETVTVPAGTFEGAIKGTQELELSGVRLTADVWHHPDVPVTGMVRFVARGEMRHQMDLVAFGETGARSVLP